MVLDDDMMGVQIVSKMSEGAQTTAPAPTAAVSDAPQPKAVSQATAGDGLQPGTSDGTPRDATSRVHRNEEMSTIVTSFQPPKQVRPNALIFQCSELLLSSYRHCTSIKHHCSICLCVCALVVMIEAGASGVLGGGACSWIRMY